MVMTTNGVLQRTKLTSLVAANNGLTVNDGSVVAADKGKVQLGGDLTKVTAIGTDDTNTLAITGLEAGDAANRIVVQDATTGVLRNVVRSIKLPNATNGTYDVTAQTGYDGSAQEIIINAQTTADVTISLPEATAANIGQVINIKKTSADEDFYVNIGQINSGLDGSNSADAVYGALPYQGWVIKSDGTTWKVI